MVDVDVSIAIEDYDHVRYLISGEVCIGGARLNFHRTSRPAETFHRQLTYEEWDVSEMSLAQFCHGVATGDDRFVGLPVFPSRCFRHSSVVVRGDSEIRTFEQLNSCRVGVPEWAQTAGIWVRGTLSDRHRVDLRSIVWYQGGVEAPGRPEHAALTLPAGLRIHRVRDAALATKLVDGDIDAIIAARFPARMIESGAVRRLLADPYAAELTYWRDTRIHPIMHVLAMRRDVYERNRWLARDLVTAFTAAKDLSVARLRSTETPMFPIPHLNDHCASTVEVYGEDPWPYGVEENRATLSVFLRYAHEQGVTPRLLEIEDLFAPSAVGEFHG